MTTSPETAVRRYLAWVEDPTTAVDPAAVEAAEAAFAAATDPIEKLHAAAAREKASAADVEAIERDFVAHAKAYAESESIPVAAFTALGVNPVVLARAGFTVTQGRGGRGSIPQGLRRVATKPRAATVPLGDVKAAALQMSKRFTLAQVADRAGGGSPVTIRKAVDELIAEGRVAKLGPAEDHKGPGRAPTVYELT